MSFCLEARLPLTRPIDRKSHIGTTNSTQEQENLEKEPQPSTGRSSLLSASTTSSAAGLRTTPIPARRGARVVQVVRSHGYNVVFIGDFTRFAGKAEVCHRRDGDVGLCCAEREAFGPGAVGFVLEVEREGAVLEVG